MIILAMILRDEGAVDDTAMDPEWAQADATPGGWAGYGIAGKSSAPERGKDRPWKIKRAFAIFPWLDFP